MPRTLPKNRLRQLVPSSLSEVDNLFEHVFGAAQALTNNWRAAASLWEADERFHLEIDAPGVSRDGVEVTFDKGVLTVNLNRPAPEGRNYHHNEQGYGEVSRTLTLPETVDPETIEAELNDGVLHVSIAKLPEKRPRKIELK